VKRRHWAAHLARWRNADAESRDGLIATLRNDAAALREDADRRLGRGLDDAGETALARAAEAAADLLEALR
jgi:hypothetical protein